MCDSQIKKKFPMPVNVQCAGTMSHDGAVCCPATCRNEVTGAKHCGGRGCENLAGGAKACCEREILFGGVFCGDSGPLHSVGPCKMPGVFE